MILMSGKNAVRSAGAIEIAFRISERLKTGLVVKTSTGEVMACYR